MAMALLFFLLLGLSLAEEDKQACHLLQTASEFRGKGKSAPKLSKLVDPVGKSTGVCLPSLSDQDRARPLKDVLADYGEDGWCIFGSASGCFSQCAVSRRTRDVNSFIKQFEGFYAEILNVKNATPFTFKLPDETTLTVRDHVYPLDDLYCYANGWYNPPIPRESLVNNFTLLEEVSGRSCEELSKTVPGFESLAWKSMEQESEVDRVQLEDMMKTGDSAAVSDKLVKNMLVHSAVKCLLRGGFRGAVCDIANCAARGCIDESEAPHYTVRYTQRGECKKLTK